MAARALAPRPEPTVSLEHVHGGAVSVREPTALLRLRLQRTGGGSFRALTADCNGTLEVVARFLGLLELYREGLVAFEQVEALGELHVRWTGSEADAEEDSAAGAEWDEDLTEAAPEDPDTGDSETDRVVDLNRTEEPG
jgi:segregation and condensation protein A